MNPESHSTILYDTSWVWLLDIACPTCSVVVHLKICDDFGQKSGLILSVESLGYHFI